MKKNTLIFLMIALTLAACGTPAPEPIVLPEPIGTQAGAAKANPEHLSKITEGVDAWNAWRAQNPDLKPDLSRADLRRADLKGYNLSGANLVGVKLIKANLTRADLRGANLTAANLTDAVLKNAVLINARLVRADLSGADLTGAKLKGAKYDSATKWPQGFDPIAAGAAILP